ncbi:kinase-like domain-containing protein [Xylaria arbuscula]|nr:kinase-like domain-containing protein [Xylaria arbuscula]
MAGLPPHPPLPSPSPPSSPLPLVGIEVLYSVPEHHLPAPLPSVQEILQGSDVCQGRADRVVQVGDHYVVKFGRDTDVMEAQNMIFVRDHLGDMVPRVYAVYQETEGGSTPPTTYMIIEFLHAQPLSALWTAMDAAQKSEIIDTLRHALGIIRNIPAPNYFGGLWRSSLKDEFLYDPFAEHDSPAQGPFDTEQELIEGIILRYDAECSPRYRHKINFYRQILPQVLQGDERSVFTHCDLQPLNIMIGPGNRLTLIDWQQSGWYPTWWEYVATMENNNWRSDWWTYLRHWMHEYPTHYSWIHTMYQELADQSSPDSDVSMSFEM